MHFFGYHPKCSCRGLKRSVFSVFCGTFDGKRETVVRLNELTRKTDFSPSHHLKTRTHVLEVVGAPTSLQVNCFRSDVAVKGSDCKAATDIVVMVTM